MKEKLERHKDRLSEREARAVWNGIRRRAFRPRKSWHWVWAVGTPVAVATAALLIFVIGRGPDLDVTPRETQVTAPDVERLMTAAEPEKKGVGTRGEALEIAADVVVPDAGDEALEPRGKQGQHLTESTAKGPEQAEKAFPSKQTVQPKKESAPRPVPQTAREEGGGGDAKQDDTWDEIRVRTVGPGEGPVAKSTTGGVTYRNGVIHVRGGRSSEVKYYVDGTSVTEPDLNGVTPKNVAKMNVLSGGFDQEYGNAQSGPPMAHGGVVPPNGEDVDAMFFKHYGVNPFIPAEDDNLSTFAIDVDTGSYTVCRAYLEDGHLPRPDAVRVEEFVNFFSHDYDPPRRGDFAIHLEAAPSEFGEDLVLLRVGLQGRVVAERDRKRSNLVFVIDTSGSMNRENRLELVKRALMALVNRMDRRDRVGIVEYGSRGRVVLRPTSFADADDIIDAIEDLRPNGSTNAEEGLRLGYEMADRAYDPDANNRVILCSDGVANVGRTGPEGILKTIKEEARRGIYLTAVGFGMGNYNDVLMEQLADHGDGHYYYVDEMKEARRVFTENLTGTLQTIARDTKVQVEFNPKVVRRYRLIGYENRDVADEDFRNDRVDAGEVGSGHQVTALYEVRLEDRAKGGRMATVRLRWENPETGRVREIDEKIDASDIHGRMKNASWSFRRDAAVVEFAEILRQSYWAREGDLRDVERLLDRLADDHGADLRGADLRRADRETLELLDLVHEARLLWDEEGIDNPWRNDDWRGGEWEED